MMRKNQSAANRRKYFLLDSNQTVRKKPKTTRNRTLNVLAKFRFFRQLGSLFKGSTLLAMACFLMLGFTLFALFSPYFNLKRVEIKRESPDLDVQAVENLMSEFYGQNLLFISQSKIQERLLRTFPEFREVRLIEKWPETLVVEVVLSPPFYQALNEFDATFSVLSEDGVVLRQEATEGLPVLKIVSYEQSLKSGEKFVSAQVLKDITALKTFFTEDLKIPIAEIRYLPTAYEVHLVSESETAFWFDLRADTMQQARKIDLVSDEINLYTDSIEHVDLRIPNQIFWKPL